MAEMFVEAPVVKRIVSDYDIILSNGAMFPLTVDFQAGDTYTTFDSQIRVHLVSKPSLSDPVKTLPAEDITIYLIHVASIQRREREVVERTPEQQAEWIQTLQEMSGTIQ